MFYRRKIILALIQMLGGELEKIRIQKLLFLFSQKKIKSEYDFIPYKYGCYSYSAKADLVTMVKKDILLENENTYTKNTSVDFIKTLKLEDEKILVEIVKLYGNMNNSALIKHTYINYPYYATKSTIADKILNEEQLTKVTNQKACSDETILFTIGYEGVSLENYLNKLLKNNVKLLVDVRKNSLSMKFGFSKSLLKKYCESIGIDYIHIPEVGINSDQRQELNSQKDYDELFEKYKKTTLLETNSYQETIINLLTKYNRIALTCFEADVCQCHRKPLAEAIAKFPIFDYKVKHL
ncbi:DUF488 domain-containing protein [Flavobacterium bomense]|uniref:DUF488 domain-containing protein n=2 Tax=Flavobacterium TaxID=237 RepID=A0A3S0MB62_9FLAO|nr:DUF488 domain-containing protein [Flavobacterium bomense]RTZ02755.1 DUF488 domain-containing protein [Flavobacterium bomense]